MTFKASMLISTLFSSFLLAAPTHCSGIYYGNEAPDILNPNLTHKARELCYSEFAVMHSGIARSPLWSAEHLFGTKLGKKVERTNDFHPEERLPADERSELSDFAHSGYDRGHMAPARDFNTVQAEHECFTLANMVNQDHTDNTGLWSGVEEATRSLAKQRGELYVITGPLFIGSTIKRVNGRVLVPTHIFKAIYDPSTGKGASYLVNNAPETEYKVLSITQIEQMSGIRLFPKMSTAAKQTPMPLPAPIMHGNNVHTIFAAATKPHNETATRDGFQCEGKRTCKEMASCEEAKFYLNQCGVSRLDGDGDGVPCEKLCR